MWTDLQGALTCRLHFHWVFGRFNLLKAKEKLGMTEKTLAWNIILGGQKVAYTCLYAMHT